MKGIGSCVIPAEAGIQGFICVLKFLTIRIESDMFKLSHWVIFNWKEVNHGAED
jgi:hypothetical protein